MKSDLAALSAENQALLLQIAELKHRVEELEMKSKSITGRDFMRRMGLSANTFYRRVREYEAEHGIAELTSA